jgi:hypothetical protein
VFLDDGAEQIALAREVVVDEAFGDVGLARDVAHRRPVEALLRKQVQARGEDVLAAVAARPGDRVLALGRRGYLPFAIEL